MHINITIIITFLFVVCSWFAGHWQRWENTRWCLTDIEGIWLVWIADPSGVWCV